MTNPVRRNLSSSQVEEWFGPKYIYIPSRSGAAIGVAEKIQSLLERFAPKIAKYMKIIFNTYWSKYWYTKLYI